MDAHVISDRAALVQSFLFMEGGALSFKRLSGLLGCSEGDTKLAVAKLKSALEGSGLTLTETDREVALTTAPRVSPAIKAAYEETLQRDIGDAGLEVLAILLYRGPSTRAQIDYIRGVHTSSTIRLLLARGLVERAGTPEDSREYVYRPTAELLAHLGVREAKELPEYATIQAELATFEQSASLSSNHDGGNKRDQGENPAVV